MRIILFVLQRRYPCFRAKILLNKTIIFILFYYYQDYIIKINAIK